MEIDLVSIPKGAVFCHYSEIAPGVFAVVTPLGVTLAPSFYDLRERYTFGGAINGAGGWVVLLPKPQIKQQSLF